MKKLTKENVFEVLCNLVGEITDENDSKIILKSKYAEKNITIDKNKIYETLEISKNAIDTDELIFVEKNYFEIAIKEASDSPWRNRYEKELFSAKDDENKLNYQISSPSLKFILLQIDHLLEIESYKSLLRPLFPISLIKRKFEHDEEASINIEKYLQYLYFRNTTIQIRSEKEKSLSEFNELLSAYIFQISYNYNIVFVALKNIHDLFKRRMTATQHRIKAIDDEREFDPPRRRYINELINYYQMAMASDSPYLAYLSYYHILEYFFDNAINDELVKKLTDKLTSPTFSYKSKRSLLDLAKMITNMKNYGNDGVSRNELSALCITIKKYINLHTLIDEIDNYDPQYIDFLKTKKVSFSDGDIVNLRNSDEQCVCKELANRIYKTRNALVHSKEMETSKYKPFHDDKALNEEMLIIRLIAEQLIINTSKVL